MSFKNINSKNYKKHTKLNKKIFITKVDFNLKNLIAVHVQIGKMSFNLFYTSHKPFMSSF